MTEYTIGISAAALLVAAATLLSQDGPPRGGQEPFCGAAVTSRWSAQGSGYKRTLTFGQDPDGWLVGLTGIATTPNRVFIYDGPGARVYVLDSMLRPIAQFGRKGGGPGELAVPVMAALDPFRHYTANSLSVDDSLVYVYDGRKIQAFGHDGTYVDALAAIRPGMMHYSLNRLQATRYGLMYNYDSLDLRGSGQRRLQTWRVLNGTTSLIHSVPVPGPTVGNRRFSASSRDPRPLWGIYNACLVWADGVSHWLVRVELAAARADTIQLPAHRVPPNNSDPALARKIAEHMNRPSPPPRASDAPLWHWAGLIVDPDGHIWVRPWTSSGLLQSGVYRIDPKGEVHTEEIPAFPIAFGPPGVFFAHGKDADTDELLVERYEKTH